MIYRKEITASTNLDARAGKPGDVFTAEFQTAGRGRLDHKWQSAKSENLMFSIVLACGSKPPAEIATLPLVVGLAVAKAFEKFEKFERFEKCETNCHLPTANCQLPAFSIKWPNDVLVLPTANCQLPAFSIKWPNDVLVLPTTHYPLPTTTYPLPTKLCGILCERVGENVIAGVGVNVNQTKFAPEISDRATSLALLAGHDVDREEILQSLIASINSYHARWMADGFASLHPEFAPFDCLKGHEISVLATDDDAAPITGVCGGIQSDGSLLVGATRVYAGEARMVRRVRG